jgi:hypothetical protein
MRKFIIAGFILAAVAVTVFSIGSFIMAQEQTPPESVTHDTSFGKVTFSHKGHVASGATCKDCHHMAETPVKQCESCHTADAKLSAKDAYHKNCIDCHKAKEKGPTGCMDCHKKG